MTKIDFSRQHKISGSKAPFRLFPVPVIDDKKYLIECSSQRLAQLLQLAINEERLRPCEKATDFSYLGLHQDGRTPIYQVRPDEVCLRVFKHESPELPASAQKVEKVLSQALIEWALSSDYAAQEKAQAKVKRLWQAQLNCKSCQSLGIVESGFESFLEKLAKTLDPES